MCHTLFTRTSKRKRKCHSTGQGKWKSPTYGALPTIAILFRSLAVHLNAAPIEVIMTLLSMAAFILSILTCQ